MSEAHRHESHPKVRNRLKRANGHLRSILEMIDEGRPCAEIAQQLHAVERAIGNAKRILIHDHVDHCLEDALDKPEEDKSASLNEFKEICRYL